MGAFISEFLNFTLQADFKTLGISELLSGHVPLSRLVAQQIRPLEHFKTYLELGYYPYFIENKKAYLSKLEETIMLSMNTDLPATYGISYGSIEKLRLLLYILAESVPFKPNISKLSERTGVSRKTMMEFLKYLEDLRIIKRLFASTKGIGLLQKPEKLYLHHPNLHFALSAKNGNTGNIRESFFINQTNTVSPVLYVATGDFKVGDSVFEIGGKNKTTEQIRLIKNSYIAADGIEIGHQNKIPLWLFGFLY